MRLSTDVLIVALLALGSCANEPAPPPTTDTDPSSFATVEKSCAYACTADPCPERGTPYACASLGEWSRIPHAASCLPWGGGYPAGSTGRCTSTPPSADALMYAGPDPSNPGWHVLPDGRHVKPSGAEWIFDESDLNGGMPSALLAIPGTRLVVEVDLGPGDHAVRVVDASKIGASNPVASYVKFSRPATLNSGVTYVAPDLVLVASDDGVLYALKLDKTTGAIARDDARNIKLPAPTDTSHAPAQWYASGVAASPDGTRLVVTGVFERRALVFDLVAGSYGRKLGDVDLGAAETFGVSFDPADAAGSRAYVTMWGSAQILEIGLADPAVPTVLRRFATDANPQGVAFLDARWMAVANDLGETLSLVDRVAGTVKSIPVEYEPGLRGLDVSSVVYDKTMKRLYASLSGLDAVAAYDVDLALTPPSITSSGRLQTSWWPGGLAVQSDGALVVASMRGYGKGPVMNAVPTAIVTDTQGVRGGIQRIGAPSAADLAEGDRRVGASVAVGSATGYPQVVCPPGARDFPLPATNTEGPSPQIKHVFFIVRENKTYDALFGDLPGGNGDPALTMKIDTKAMDAVWPNTRALASAFARSDNFYSSAIRSSQGHMWTAYGRTTDFTERTWGLADIVGRSARGLPTSGVSAVGQPAEGSLFDWLGEHGVNYDILGEFVGAPKKSAGGKNPIDARYPGGPIQSIDYHDGEKACYVAGRARVLCDLGDFVYMTLPNDHAFGVAPERPSPESMCAVNDDATGMVVDAIAHSPLWSSSLIVITEDDPQQGADHVDYHRAPLVLVSPWVRRGYVSKTHVDVASLHKIFAHVFGLPYPNVLAKNAGLPFDMFTSTPDFTPFARKPRSLTLSCGLAATRTEVKLTRRWDFAEADEQPGHDAQIMRWMRGAQLDDISPEQLLELESRRITAPWLRARGATNED